MKKSRGKFSFALFYQKFGVFILLVILFAAAAILSPNFLKPANLRNVLRQIVIISVIASGGCYVLICGQMNLAYDGLIACLGCISCILMVATNNVVIAVGGTMILGAFIGYLYGTCVTTLGVPSFIVGLAFSSMASGAIMLYTGGTKITGMGDAFAFLGKGSVGPIPMSVIIMALCLILSHILLTKSTFGRKVFAVGGNKQAAKASGINSGRIVRKVFVLDGVTTALAGILFMSRLGSGQPSAGQGYAFDAITGAVVGGCSIYGGKGSLVGCLIGASIVGILKNILNLMNVSSYWQQVFSGSIILLAVLIDLATKEAAAVAIKNQMADKKVAAAA